MTELEAQRKAWERLENNHKRVLALRGKSSTILTVPKYQEHLILYMFYTVMNLNILICQLKQPRGKSELNALPFILIMG